MQFNPTAILNAQKRNLCTQHNQYYTKNIQCKPTAFFDFQNQHFYMQQKQIHMIKLQLNLTALLNLQITQFYSQQQLHMHNMHCNLSDLLDLYMKRFYTHQVQFYIQHVQCHKKYMQMTFTEQYNINQFYIQNMQLPNLATIPHAMICSPCRATSCI